MIVLDTNVVSALMAPAENDNTKVVDWLDRQPTTSVWTTSISVMELRFGIERLVAGRRRQALATAFEAVVRIDLMGRVLGFDEAEAIETAALTARRRAAGRTAGLSDDMIAGIVRANHATLATRNTRHFVDAGFPLVDPWTAV